MPAYAIPDPKTQKLPVAENIFKSLILLALLFSSMYGANWIANAVDASTLSPAPAFVLKWGAICMLALFNGMLITGLGVLAHEGIHRIFCRSPFWNELLGGTLSSFALLPFYANRQFHLTHHSYTHQPGMDPENAMHNHSFWYAAIMGMLIAFKEQYRLMLINIMKIGDRRYTGRALKDIAFMAFAIGLYFWAVPALGISVWYTVVPTIVLFVPIFTLRAISDHYGIPAVVRAKRERQEVLDADDRHWDKEVAQRHKELSSWIILTYPWMDWLWSHINYHEVHHRYPYIAHVYLKEIFEATRGKDSYLVVHGFLRSLINQMGRSYYGKSTDKTPLPDPYA
jgi:fatty acid desaturase